MTTIANRIARLMTGAHARLYRATGGKVASRMGGQQLCLLTTTGRRTGRQHTTPLTCFPRGSDVVVVASNAGSDRHPSWYLNLQARPTVRLQVRDEVREMTARTASVAPDRGRREELRRLRAPDAAEHPAGGAEPPPGRRAARRPVARRTDETGGSGAVPRTLSRSSRPLSVPIADADAGCSAPADGARERRPHLRGSRMPAHRRMSFPCWQLLLQ